MLFVTLYTQPLSDVIEDYNINYQKFADDTQLHNASQPAQFQSLTTNFESCMESIKAWMINNKLKLNDDKTEALVVGSRSYSNLINSQSLEIGGNCNPFKTCVKDLGVYLDNTLSMHHHISHLCRSSFLALRRIGSIRSYLTESTTAQLVSSFITSRLDYCNATLAGLPAVERNRLQRVQNSAARLVMKKSKRDHVSPLLQRLHWLPIPARIDYKIATLAYRHFEDSLPPYLSSALSIYHPSRSLRSSSEKLLKVPRKKSKVIWSAFFQLSGSHCLELTSICNPPVFFSCLLQG
jgi:hypothetical protein